MSSLLIEEMEKLKQNLWLSGFSVHTVVVEPVLGEDDDGLRWD